MKESNYVVNAHTIPHCRPHKTSNLLCFLFPLQWLDLLPSEIPATMSIYGKIDAHTILEAINPRVCIHCTNPKPNSAIKTFCPNCTTRILSDTPLSLLYGAVLPLYAFCIAFLKKTLSRRFTIVERRSFSFEKGTPGWKETLPVPHDDVLEWERNGAEGWMRLDQPAQELLEQVLLTDMQSGDAILLMAELMRVHLLDDRECSPNATNRTRTTELTSNSKGTRHLELRDLLQALAPDLHRPLDLQRTPEGQTPSRRQLHGSTIGVGANFRSGGIVRSAAREERQTHSGFGLAPR